MAAARAPLEDGRRLLRWLPAASGSLHGLAEGKNGIGASMRSWWGHTSTPAMAGARRAAARAKLARRRHGFDTPTANGDAISPAEHTNTFYVSA